MPHYKSVAAQKVVKKYAERWGVNTLDARSLRTYGLSRYFIHAELAIAGIYIAGFGAKHAIDNGQSAVDTVRGCIYLPFGTVEPYLLLHELTHLMQFVTEGGLAPPQQVESKLFAALEGYSVTYMSRISKHVTLRGWLNWRCATSEFDSRADLLHYMDAYRSDVLGTYLFYEKDGLLEPSFWNLFPADCTS